MNRIFCLSLLFLLQVSVSSFATGSQNLLRNYEFDGNLKSTDGNSCLKTSGNINYVNGVSGSSCAPGGVILKEVPKKDVLTLGAKGNPFSVSFWFKPEKNTGYRILLAKSAAGPHRRSWWIGYIPQTRQVDFYVKNNTDGKSQVRSERSVNLLGWNHVVAVYDGKNITISSAPEKFAIHIPAGQRKSLKGYVNQSDIPLTVGGRTKENPNNYFSGAIDSLKFYNKALTPEEINSLFRKDMKKEVMKESTLKFITAGKLSSNAVIKRGNLKLKPEILYGNFSLKFIFSITNLKDVDTTVWVGADGFNFNGKTGLLTNCGNEGIRDYKKKPLKINWEKYIKGGKDITVNIKRNDGKFSLLINGQLAFSNSYTRDTVGQVSVTSRKTGMKIKELSGSAVWGTTPETVTVFQAGKDKTSHYRIPALVATPKGTLLAFAEARRDNYKDLGNIDIVMKRSEDQGKTWSPMMLIYEEGGSKRITCSNPAPVIDHTTGKIFLLFQVCEKWGQGKYKLMVTSSNDDGKTWSKPQNIKKQATKDNWLACQPGPGHGIQLTKGKFKGRLVVPVWHCTLDKKGKRIFGSAVIFSDDNGKTWHPGGTALYGSDECMAVELSDGSVMLAIRPGMKMKNALQRRTAISKDCVKWSTPLVEKNFKSVICQGSIIRTPEQKLLFCHPGAGNHSNYREHRAGLTVRSSSDDGKTWTSQKLLFPGRSAYSDIAVLPGGYIGCLFEGTPAHTYNEIKFIKFKREF